MTTPGNSPQRVTKKEFAEIMGVSQAAVSRALKTGRITSTWVGGKERIDVEQCTRQWREYTRPYRRSGEAPEPPTTSLDVEDGADMTLHDARTKRETHEARIAEMKERQLAGSLVDAEGVRAAALRGGRLIRDSVLGVPTRIAHDIAQLADPWAVQKAMEEALAQALTDAARLAGNDLEEALADGR
jgi:phage terminase Nu1 subunit (DNA packaging protein)